ncbi:superinfection immunity protein [Pseudoalteromonas sp. SSM20]|uniref:superinfection immunity protein n=1 Tax=unclassified Pseudoalteromonas TaxID=194690 RepID=UPI00237E8950|nr:superinfection immunity protein [Pseudoalteromonas sp. G4]MDE3272029.1 superinfection immunity protein [Pseudoalteromonas sp. G4]
METLTFFEEFFANANPVFVLGVALVTLVLWFLPAILAFFLNRKHAKVITVACVPAGFSLIAWSGLFLWAVTGKSVERVVTKSRKEQVTPESN